MTQNNFDKLRKSIIDIKKRIKYPCLYNIKEILRDFNNIKYILMDQFKDYELDIDDIDLDYDEICVHFNNCHFTFRFNKSNLSPLNFLEEYNNFIKLLNPNLNLKAIDTFCSYIEKEKWVLRQLETEVKNYRGFPEFNFTSTTIEDLVKLIRNNPKIVKISEEYSDIAVPINYQFYQALNIEECRSTTHLYIGVTLNDIINIQPNFFGEKNASSN